MSAADDDGGAAAASLNPALDPSAERDDALDIGVRPRCFADYVGQARITENLQVFVQAAKGRGDALDHLLLTGPPGLGKTTLAHILAQEMHAGIHVTSGPAIERTGDLAGILTGLNEGDILFIDEIHRLNPVVEEYLYPAMEDFRFDIVLGDGPHARTVTLDLKRFTLVGATTRIGLLTSPMRDRFGMIFQLEYYTVPELVQILRRSARIYGIGLDDDAAEVVARRGRGTPRIVNRLLRRLRDYAQVDADGHVDAALASRSLDRLDVDEAGLDRMDQRYLDVLCRRFSGGPVGVETLAASLSEERSTLEDVHEPFLLQQGFIQRTPRGRVALARAWRHLGLASPAAAPGSAAGGSQQPLFDD